MTRNFTLSVQYTFFAKQILLKFTRYKLEATFFYHLFTRMRENDTLISSNNCSNPKLQIPDIVESVCMQNLYQADRTLHTCISMINFERAGRKRDPHPDTLSPYDDTQ